MPFLNRIGSGSTSKFGFRMGFAPGAPTSVTASLPATYGNTTALVSWTAPVLLGSPALYDYIVQYSSDHASPSYANNQPATWTTFSDSVSNSTSVTVTGLTNGTAYIFRVAANYYGFTLGHPPNDTNGSCHGWTGIAENENRFTYVHLSKDGWANSDAIYIEETTNVTPPCTAHGTYIGVVCVGYDLYDQYHDGACGTYNSASPIEVNSVEGCGYVAPPPPPPPVCTTTCSCVCCDPQNQCGYDYKNTMGGVCGDGSFCYTYP